MSERVWECARDVVAGLGLELVDVEVSRGGNRLLVRILVDKEGGVTLEDCSAASGMVGEVLEREEAVPGRYVLEVSSPGLTRSLKKKRDFQWGLGKKAKVKLRQPYEGRRDFTGIIREAREESVVLEVGEEILELPYDELSGARLEPELPW